MALTFPQVNPARLRSYILRLPIFTRITLLLLVFLWLLELQSVWDVIQWGSLIPQEVGLSTSWWSLFISSSSAMGDSKVWMLTFAASVSAEHVPITTRERSSCPDKCHRSNSVIGTVRGGTWDLGHGGHVRGP